MHKIRILHITTAFSASGGIEETLRIICSKLNPDRFTIGICSIQDKSIEFIRNILDSDVQIECLGKKGARFDLFTMLALRKKIKQFNADIIHTHREKGNFHGRLAGWTLPKIQIVTTHHDMHDLPVAKTSIHNNRTYTNTHDQPRPSLSAFAGSYLNVLLNGLNAKIIAVGNNVRDIYTQDPSDPRFAVVNAPYDEALFFYRYNGLKSSLLTIGIVGRLSWEKGHLTLLQALNKLNKNSQNYRLKIIGDGECRTQIKTRIGAFGLTAQVELCGNVAHNRNLYNNIDIYVQPSLFEGCSISILEAMAIGIPVIASNIDGPKEIIADGKTGILIPAEDPDALVNAIKFLAENRETARKMGKVASEAVKQRYSSTIFAEKMATIYQSLVLATHLRRDIRQD